MSQVCNEPYELPRKAVQSPGGPPSWLSYWRTVQHVFDLLDQQEDGENQFIAILGMMAAHVQLDDKSHNALPGMSYRFLFQHLDRYNQDPPFIHPRRHITQFRPRD